MLQNVLSNAKEESRKVEARMEEYDNFLSAKEKIADSIAKLVYKFYTDAQKMHDVNQLILRDLRNKYDANKTNRGLKKFKKYEQESLEVINQLVVDIDGTLKQTIKQKIIEFADTFLADPNAAPNVETFTKELVDKKEKYRKLFKEGFTEYQLKEAFAFLKSIDEPQAIDFNEFEDKPSK